MKSFTYDYNLNELINFLMLNLNNDNSYTNNKYLNTFYVSVITSKGIFDINIVLDKNIVNYNNKFLMNYKEFIVEFVSALIGDTTLIEKYFLISCSVYDEFLFKKIIIL